MSQGFYLGDRFNGVCGDSFTFGTETLYTYKVGCFDRERFTESIVTTKANFYTRIGFAAIQYKARSRVFAEEILLACRRFHLETFQVWIPLLVSIVEGNCPYEVGIELLNQQYIGLVVVGKVEVGSIEIAIVEYDQNRVVAIKLAKAFAASVVVEA